MTYTEIIDNIQTRIENIISERFAGTYQHITIEPSDYNPDIDDEITVTITVTDQNDDPISNWTVPLLVNGVNVTDTLVTDSNGQVTYTHSCDDWGVCRFSVKSFTCFIKVGGWRTHLDTGESSDSRWIVEYNETTTRVTLSYSQSQSVPTSVTNYGTTLFPSSVSYLRPSKPVMFPVYNGAMVVMCGESSTTMQRRTIYGTSQFTASSQYWQVEWTHQGLP